MIEIQTGVGESLLGPVRVGNAKMTEILTSADSVLLWLRAHLVGHALGNGEIICILQTVKDDMSTDLADSQKVVEEDRKSDSYCDGDDGDEPPAGWSRDQCGRHEGRSR